jgi:SAM-dependent methyltransferase
VLADQHCDGSAASQPLIFGSPVPEMQSPTRPAPPSAWIVRHAGLVQVPGPVLDLAAGSGRHTRFFKGLGHRVTAVDRDVSGLADLAADPLVEVIAADLEDGSPWPLAGQRFGGIVVTNYLHRPLLPLLAAALLPGGVLLYETFARGNERFGRPSNPDFLLRPGELLDLAEVEGLTVRAYRHGTVAEPRPAITQGIVAQRQK